MPALSPNKRILMVEDTASVAALYKSYLNPLDVDVTIVGKGQDALTFFEQEGDQLALIILDLRLPDMSGIDVLAKVRAVAPDLPVIIMTAHGSIDAAVDAMRHGANDFLIKPCEADQLRVTVNKSLKPKSSHQSNTSKPESEYHGFIGSSLPMQAVYRVIESAAPSKATVFITGESGTGKEVCAEAIHAASTRSNKPIVALNCAAIPKDLIESELFGHVKGAFTGAAAEREGAAEMAHGGTLFLDEICEMDMDLQSKLLRFIQTGSFQKVGSSHVKNVDVRFVCATNQDPWLQVQQGKFREDLYYRLHVIPLELPPLSARGDDVLAIANALLAVFSAEEGKDFCRFSDEVADLLLRYDWPGNVRQLQNVIRNIVVLHNGEEVSKEMLPSPVNRVSGAEIASPQHNAGSDVTTSAFSPNHLVTRESSDSTPSSLSKADIEPLWKIEKRAIEAAIDVCNGNIPQAAGLLEVSPSTLYRKLQAWQKTAANE